LSWKEGLLKFRIYRIFQLLMVGALAMGIFWGWRYLINPSHFPIRVVKLQATYTHIDPRQLQQIIVPFVSRGFFGLNEARLQQSLLSKLPWINKAELQRIWPDIVVIRITEYHPAAHWVSDKLIDVNGKLFSVPEASRLQNLPLLNGPAAYQKQIWDLYLAMSKSLLPLRLRIQKLEMDNRQAYSLVLNNGAQVLLGRREPLPRLQRFVKVYPKIFTPTRAQAERIDLRYQNGLTVKWRDETNKSEE
jgi:cell division protein FtsQ